MSSRAFVNGISINYRIDGLNTAPIVVLSNSLMTNYGMWDSQVQVLKNKYRVLRYDQRGHGTSDAPKGPYSIDMLAQDVLGLLDALNITEKVHFVGLSMGGFTGQRVALNHGDRLRTLVLADTAAHMPPPSLWDERINLAQTEGMKALEAGSIDRWFTKDFQRKQAATVNRIRDGIRSTPVDGFIGCCEAIKVMDHRESVEQIKTPTLIIVGEHDPGTPVAAAQFLHNAIAGSKLIVIKDAAHLANIQQADVFNKALLEFLDRH